MSGAEAIDRALVGLQRALTPDEVWTACSQLLRAAVPLQHTLMGLPSIGIAPAFLRTTLPFPNTEAFLGRLAELAPLNDVLSVSSGIKLARMSDYFSRSNPRHESFYNEMMLPYGWRFSAALLFWNEAGGFIGQLALTRTKKHGDITEVEMEQLRRLHPHVEAALQRLVRHERAASLRLSLEQAIDALPLPVAILGWNLKLDYCNAVAAEALHTWRHGSRHAREFKRSRELPDELLAACGALKTGWEEAQRRNDFSGFEPVRSLTRNGEPDSRAVIRLVPPRNGRALQPAFLIELHLPPAANPEVTRALARLSLLTSSERQVARLAAAGYHNADIAGRLGVSVHTVRSHLRNAFAKLGISSRSRLAPMYHVLAGPVQGRPEVLSDPARLNHSPGSPAPRLKPGNLKKSPDR